MGRKYSPKNTLIREAIWLLHKMLDQGKGNSKHYAKLYGSLHYVIFSYETFSQYVREIKDLCDHCYRLHGCRTVADCRAYAAEWLQSMIDRGLSAWTVYKRRSAAAKLFGCRGPDICPVPKERRADIKRSRAPKSEKTLRWEERNQDLVAFFRGSGLRRHELLALRKGDLVYRDGHWFVYVRRGKGGRSRYALYIGDVAVAQQLFLNADEYGRVFPKISSCAPIHSYRRDYAQAFYEMVARDVTKLDKSETYRCRKDKLGVVYDREAMLTVSLALGHERISVVAGHYLDQRPSPPSVSE